MMMPPLGERRDEGWVAPQGPECHMNEKATSQSSSWRAIFPMCFSSWIELAASSGKVSGLIPSNSSKIKRLSTHYIVCNTSVYMDILGFKFMFWTPEENWAQLLTGSHWLGRFPSPWLWVWWWMWGKNRNPHQLPTAKVRGRVTAEASEDSPEGTLPKPSQPQSQKEVSEMYRFLNLRLYSHWLQQYTCVGQQYCA